MRRSTEPPGGSEPDPQSPAVQAPPEDAPVVVIPEATGAPEGTQPPPAPFPTKRSKRRVLVMGIAGLLIGIAGVVALLLTRDEPAPPQTDAAGEDASATVPAPTGLDLTAEPFEVTVNWNEPGGGETVEGYEIYRDNTFLARVNAPITIYLDDTVVPGSEYDYEVRAFRGTTESDTITGTVETGPGPLRLARVQGNFDARVHATSTSGYSSYDRDYTLGWSFEPRCDEGVCAVRWKDLFFKSLRTKLNLRGVWYQGSVTGRFHTNCGSVPTSSTVTLRLRVVKAAAVRDAWRATKLAGTLVHSEPAQLGCVSSSATLKVKASLVR